jgi:hypothetical protein
LSDKRPDESASALGAKDFPPRSFPPSFNPANVLESTMDTLKQKDAQKAGLDLNRIRGNLKRMIEQHQKWGDR